MEAIYINRNPSDAIREIVGAVFGMTAKVTDAGDKQFHVQFDGDDENWIMLKKDFWIPSQQAHFCGH